MIRVNVFCFAPPFPTFGYAHNSQLDCQLRISPRRYRMCTSASVLVGDVSSRLGNLVEKCASEAIQKHGRFSVAISGGSLPKQLSQGLPSDTDFSNWDVFLADERIVPLDHEDSNHRLILSHFPNMSVVAIDPDLSPEECAKHYEQAVVKVLGESPKFDAILLGIGPDGHTCSLFPGHKLVRCTSQWFKQSAHCELLDTWLCYAESRYLNLNLILTIPFIYEPQLEEKDRIVTHITDSPKPPPQRVTLTLPVVNAALTDIFVCTGEGKAPAVKDILEVSFIPILFLIASVFPRL